MPEGDTIHRTAIRLARALAGKTIVRFESGVPEISRAKVAGRAVTAVDARGKHLAMRFDDGHVLLTHMRMTGSWHLYKAGEKWWRLSARGARRASASAPRRATPPSSSFASPRPSFVSSERTRPSATSPRWVPDVVADRFAPDAALAELRAVGGDRPIGVAIMDQSALAGVGNVYKSEVLFAERVSPLARVADLDDATLSAIVARARALMRRNLAPGRGMRTTTSGLAAARHAVYRRSGEPCPRCGATIVRIVQGPMRRSTYYCRVCQQGGQAGGRTER